MNLDGRLVPFPRHLQKVAPALVQRPVGQLPSSSIVALGALGLAVLVGVEIGLAGAPE